jgi:hypothetical protein
MSRQGLDVRGISKPRRISVKTGRQQVRLCTAGAAKGQAAGNRKAKDPFEPAGIGPLEIKDLAAKNLAGKNLAARNLTGRSGRARTCDPRFWRPSLKRQHQTVSRDRAVKPRPERQWVSPVLSNLHVAERDDGLFEILPAGSGPFPTRAFAESVAMADSGVSS